jgi:hypothetical protein
MRFQRVVSSCLGLLLLVVFCNAFLGGSPAIAQSEATLYDFGGGTDGGAPEAGLIFDRQGNLYGSTSGGGIIGGCELGLGCGTVFELSPSTGGGWTLATLYTFQGGSDGAGPAGPLLMDVSGNLFGETLGGGHSGGNCLEAGCGTVFELSPDGSGGWVKQTLYMFQVVSDGNAPYGGLALDSAGNLYGTTIQGGGICSETKAGCGTAFELIPQAGGHWLEAIIHRFGSGRDGYAPAAGFAFDAKGNLVSSTALGGLTSANCPLGCGIVFELTLSGGQWQEQILHSFDFTDGSDPQATPVPDSAGNVYVTTYEGGSGLGGTVVELSPQPGATWWRPQVLHEFAFSAGVLPRVGAMLSGGNLYGVTEYGGNNAQPCRSDTDNGCGVVYEMSKTASGEWQYRVLYRFSGGQDGNYPVGVPVIDTLGNLYGTTLYRGQTLDTGTVFEVKP